MRNKLIILFLFILCSACTHNPFFSDEIKTNEKFSFKGNVQLPFTNDHSDIHVYLEGLDVLTKTDPNGDFTIEMPIEPGLQPGQGLTGFYNVYYYVVNYEIAHSSIFVNKGEFVYSVADLDKNGMINRRIVLRQLLDVVTEINPEEIKQNHSDEMIITVQLDNRVDSVIVFSNFTKENKLASAYLTDRDFPHNNIHLLSQPSTVRSVIIDSLVLWTMNVNWPVDGSEVEVGRYNVIPYLFVYQAGIPEALLKKMGLNATWYSHNFLKLTFRRQIAELNVRENSD